MYGDKAFQLFYEVLADSMMLVDWLRENTHGMARKYYVYCACS